MRIFLASFLLITMFVLGMIYSPTARELVKQHGKRLLLIVPAVLVTLLMLFTLMSVSTWRIF